MSAEQTKFPNPARIHKPGDRAVVELADEILALKPESHSRYNYWGVASNINPQKMQKSLRSSSFGDMILPECFSLVWPTHHQHSTFKGYPVTKLGENKSSFTVRSKQLHSVDLEAGGSEYINEDTKLFGPDYWQRYLGLTLWYKDEEYTGGQELVIRGDSRMETRGGPFSVIRNIISPVFVETRSGPETWHDTHSNINRGYFDQEELVALAGLYRQAFEARVEATVAV